MGWGGRELKRGVLGWVWGGCHVRTYPQNLPKGVCDGGVENRRWGWDSGKKETASQPSGQKETTSGQIVSKVVKSALELGEGKSIILGCIDRVYTL